jgi:2-polyprenyl-6-methoxyphenol hydroxylase-like FAD-dependent oxidoreductase
MRLVCVGGGPAGLVLAISLKRADSRHAVTVLERQSDDTEEGWGLTIPDDLLAALRETDPDIAAEIAAWAAPWAGQQLFVRGERADQEGRGYAIGRPYLLRILTARARELGVEVRFGEQGEIAAIRDTADVVALCDGMNSASRNALAAAFGTNIDIAPNKYVWLGTTAKLEAFTFAFVRTPAGWIWFYGYPYDDARGTCVVECTAETWSGLGFEHQTRADAIEHLEDIFRDHLAGGRLIGRGNETPDLEWFNFKWITNDRWHSENLVLVGDAAHSTHFSIGSGTKLAIADAKALASSLAQHGPTSPAFIDYEARRRPETHAAQDVARHSAAFFEHIERYADLPADMFLTVLRARRHAWLPRVPPRLYANTYALTQRVPALRHARERLRSRIRKF